jgi:hypothetical protein
MSCAKCTVAFILGCLSVTSLFAQTPSCQLRTIPVSVVSKDNSPLPSLSGANFKGEYQKKPVHIASATVNQEPPRVVLLLDASGSMQGPKSKWNFAVRIGEDLVTRLPPATEIGLVIFSTKSIRVATPTNERQKLKSELETLRADSNALPPEPRKTALWDAVIDSFNILDPPHLGDVIYVITDGEDNASSSTSKKVIQTLGAVGVRLFAFAVHGGGIQTDPEEIPSLQKLLQIVEDSGGIFVNYRPKISAVVPYFPDPEVFDKSGKLTTLGLGLALQYQQMLSFYRLDIDLPGVVDRPRELKLGLVGFGKSQQESMVLTYPDILLPCQ